MLKENQVSPWVKCVHDREYAIKEATEYGLQNEVIYCMDVLGMSPDVALMEWDI